MTVRRQAAVGVVDDLEAQILRVVDAKGAISLTELRGELERRLSAEQRSLLQLALYNLLNDKMLALTPKRELKRAAA